MQNEPRKLTRIQQLIVGAAIVPMIAVAVAGGIGTYSNIGGKYGDETALGALAAGEGATAVLALVLLVTTLLGQSAPSIVRVGLWALPAAAAVMASTAATDTGQAIVFALTPMAITASAEGIAFLSRRVVVHQEGRDAEAESRAARIIRDLAYHESRSVKHPGRIAKWWSLKKSWRLAAKVGSGDVRLGADLMDIQRARLGAGADTALERMFGGAPVLSLPTGSGSMVPSAPGTAPTEGTEGTEVPARPEGTESTDHTALGAPLGQGVGIVSGQVSTGAVPAGARMKAVMERMDRLPGAGNSAALLGKPALSGALKTGKPALGRGKPSAKPLAASMAEAVREVIASGVTDRAEIARLVPDRLATTPKPDSLRREITRQMPAVQQPAPTGTGQYL
ncbi:conjugal transfer protein [[Kitasatospora] papulosa]|uniref:conjugal transfer protein n=1 Tax=[Kitasatospora] papulosa TaxID=1464011 RepID=UPI00403C4DE1